MSKFVAPFYALSDVMLFPLAALCFFFTVFVVIAVFAYRMKTSEADELAGLVFDDEPAATTRTKGELL